MRIPGRTTARELDGRVALVTGGARGIGRATAQRLSRAGMRVAIGDKDAEAVRSTAEEIGVLGLELDVTDPASWRAVVGTAPERVGPVDLLVNNAGITIGRAHA